MKTPSLAKSLAFVWTSKSLMKSKNSNIGVEEFFFSSPQMPYVELLFPFERKLLFREIQKWFFHLQ